MGVKTIFGLFDIGRFRQVLPYWMFTKHDRNDSYMAFLIFCTSLQNIVYLEKQYVNMIRNYINRTLHTNLLLREEEAYNTYGHKAPKDMCPQN